MKGIFAVLLLVGTSLALPQHGPIGFPNSDGKIIGGVDAEKGEFPWQVSLQVLRLNGQYSHNCGGSIFNSTHIICAGHCLVNQVLSNLLVIAGAHNISDSAEASQQRIPVRSYRVHEDYNGIFIANDVGLIEVETPIQFNEYAQPITICQEEPAAQEPVINTGWGNANPTGGVPAVLPDILQKVDLYAITRNTCRLSFPLNIREHMVCAQGDVQSGACNGDSGGPLIYKPAASNDYCLTGIVSFGNQICGTAPTVYTSPVFFADWIGA